MLSHIQNILTLDFESYFNSKEGYSLKKLTTEEYIRSPQFLAHGCAYHWYGDNATTPEYLRQADLAAFFASVEWGRTAILCHNTAFDGAILSWLYGRKPCFVFDTLSMARALRGVDGGNSLEKLAEDFGLPPKGKALHGTDGLRVLPEDAHRELASYCEHDTWLCEEIFKRLSQGFPKKELEVIDSTLQMYLNPVLELDAPLLEKEIEKEAISRGALLSRLAIDEKQLASNDRFATALRALGCNPSLKTSKSTGKSIYAFAKSDAEFQALCGSESDDIRLLCEARLRTKSTLERTRAQRFLDISGRGCLPVPLNYYGAHTGRWSASKGGGINLQNLKRGSFLRQSIHAPPGYILCVGDLAQIEVRILAQLAQDEVLLNLFRSGVDVYATFGSGMFGQEISKETHPLMRQSSKSALLGCGFQLSWANFAGQLIAGFMGAPPVLYDKAFAKQLGVTASDVYNFTSNEVLMERALQIPRVCDEESIVLHCIATKKIVEKYRAASPRITQFWKTLGNLLETAIVGGNPTTLGPLGFDKENIRLPSGMSLRYPDLQATKDQYGRNQWTYNAGKKRKKVYSGSLTENVVQAVARCVMSDAMIGLKKLGLYVALTVHDELMIMVKESEAEWAEQTMHRVLTTSPLYLPNIPLDATVSCAKSYGDAK